MQSSDHCLSSLLVKGKFLLVKVTYVVLNLGLSIHLRANVLLIINSFAVVCYSESVFSQHSLFTALSYPGRNRQSGEHNNSSEKDNKNEGTVTNNDRNAGESGRGRGSRDDRWSDRKPGGRGAELLLACLKMTIMLLFCD